MEQLKDRYLHGPVENAYPFQTGTRDRLNDAIQRLTQLYAKCVTHNDHGAAQRQLKFHQREHIAWERDTVWRQMIGNARRGEQHALGSGIGGAGTAVGGPLGSLALPSELETGLVQLPTPVGRFRLTRRKIYLLVAVIVFIILLNVRTLEAVEANNCFAILLFATILWATEVRVPIRFAPRGEYLLILRFRQAIPLFVTSIFVPLLLVCLRVIRDTDGNERRLTTPEATK